MYPKFLLIALLISSSSLSFTQDLDKDKLDQFFTSLEQRDEAMASITISKNGTIRYQRAIGIRNRKDGANVPSDIETNYRIWSITKTYTATMIMQLIEEDRLSLNTKLDQFYPAIPNASTITIENMLSHTSGIYDFTNDSEKALENNMEFIVTHESMVKRIAKGRPTSAPNGPFNYSNSNYLLLGYIIEQLDGNLYEISLDKRISSRIGLTSTYFGVGALDNVDNKAHTYVYSDGWKANAKEGSFSGLIPAGAGGIVSTTLDMAIFIDALFSEKLISRESLNKMTAGPASYNLGLMKTEFRDRLGFGHTGGYVAESSLFYYPQDSLAIAYCTNGIVLPKEEILEHVLKIYYDLPFGISWNRGNLFCMIWGVGLLLFVLVKYYSKTSIILGLRLGYIIPIVYCLGVFVAGYLNSEHYPIRDGLTELDRFYSTSGTAMTSTNFLTALLLFVFLYYSYKNHKATKQSLLPLIPTIFVIISLLGASYFSHPSSFYFIFVNIIILSVFGPLVTLIHRWRYRDSRVNILLIISLLLIIIPLAVILLRPSIPEFVMQYFGLLQRMTYLGIGVWVITLSYYQHKDTA